MRHLSTSTSHHPPAEFQSSLRPEAECDKLAGDPDLLEKMAEGKMPTPNNAIGDEETAPPEQFPPVVPGLVPGMPPAPVMPGNAPVDPTGLIQQEAGFVDPRLTPPGYPPVEDPLLAELGGGGY